MWTDIEIFDGFLQYNCLENNDILWKLTSFIVVTFQLHCWPVTHSRVINSDASVKRRPEMLWPVYSVIQKFEDSESKIHNQIVIVSKEGLSQ